MKHDMTQADSVRDALEVIRANPGCDLWGSLPCTPWTSWQRLNLKRGGEALKQRIEKMREVSRVLTANYLELAREVIKGGGHVAYEWPASCDGWRQPHVQAMMEELGMKRVVFEGCSFGMRATSGKQQGMLMRKGWAVATDADELVRAFDGHRCSGGHDHAVIQGGNTAASAFYPDEMCILIHQALEMQKFVDTVTKGPRAAPAATKGTVREGQDTPHADGWTWAGPELPEGGGHRERVAAPALPLWCAMVTRVIPAGSPEFKCRGAQAALQAEREVLEKNKVYLLETVREWQSVVQDPSFDEAMCGRIFAIMGKKGDELASDGANGDVKYKARGVFAGNNVQTKTGTAAHELYTEVSNCPATMASARAVMAAAAVKGWDVTLRDAEAAYLQSSILGKGRPTCWVRLPRAWWPSSWFGPDGAPLFRDPVVQLARALYGHPESGALWEQHLANILREQGWSPIDAWPGVWRHDETGMVIVVYVDDLLMAGLGADTKRLWATIEKSVGFKDPAEPIGRYLGAYHKFVTTTSTGLRQLRRLRRHRLRPELPRPRQHHPRAELPRRRLHRVRAELHLRYLCRCVSSW